MQGHASPGIYARAFLDGRLTEEHLDRFRREAGGEGLPSYPHPRRLPWLWEFPTVSMGLGPLSAIYQARFNRYLTDRGIKDTSASHVWAFLGDGEMDEPESTAALALAAREGLDNLTFVINCNLQRLDGPVRANFKIVQELEAQFRGAGWNVVKSLWGAAWDELLRWTPPARWSAGCARCRTPSSRRTPTRDAAYIREHFFGADPALAEMAKLLSDDKITRVLPHLPRRPRAAQGLRGVPGGRRAQGRADRDPRADRQGLHAGPGLRVAQRQPPDEEAHGGRVPGDARPAGAAHPGQRAGRRAGAVRAPRRGLPGGALPPGAPRRARRPRPGPQGAPGRAAARPRRQAVRRASTRAPAPRRSPPPWRSSAWSRT